VKMEAETQNCQQPAGAGERPGVDFPSEVRSSPPCPLLTWHLLPPKNRESTHLLGKMPHLRYFGMEALGNQHKTCNTLAQEPTAKELGSCPEMEAGASSLALPTGLG
jgi:hypothetical protein